MKVVPYRYRKPHFSSPNMAAESSRKRRLAKKNPISPASEHKVVSKWLDYYEDGSTDEEIEALENRRSVRNKRMKVLRESIRREKEEKERKTKLLCSTGFSQEKALEISDDDSC